VCGQFKRLKLQRRQQTYRLLPDDSAMADLDHVYFQYAGGIDGSGKLAQAFNGSRVYHHVMVKREHWERARDYVVPTEVLEHYKCTQVHLRDTQEGHLRNEHPLTKNLKEAGIKAVVHDIDWHTGVIQQPNYLIYVELEHDQPGDRGHIVSLGHHFRYRWRYADTVRTHWTGGTEFPTRAILRPLPQERPASDATGKHQPPQQLSGARLFFGYVVDEETPGTARIGKGDYTRLAGRLAFNMALEVLPEYQDPTNESRFVNSRQACVVPLKILAAPRPSAVEHYLTQARRNERQDGGTLITYGDLFTDSALAGEPRGELKGRKFYLHQPDAASDATCYQQLDDETVKGNQVALARFISKPGAQFRFTLRFQNLRLWELGAVLLALEPEPLLDEALRLASPGGRRRLENIKNAAGTPAQPLFAHKLGHGRPLGLGSVRIQVDELHYWTSMLELVKDDLRTQAQAAFLEKFRQIPEDVRLLWLQMHQYRGRSRAAYPTKDGTIYHYHTEKRRDHAKKRRCWRNAEQTGRNRP
jgi:CRISPR-associated protein (TIGR03986 family)